MKRSLASAMCGRAAPLHSYLHHALVFARRIQHGRAFAHVHANRFLHIDIGARLHGVNHGQSVPVVGRAHQNNIEIFFGQHFAIVAVGAWRLFRRLPRRHNSGCFAQLAFIHIAQRNHLYGGHLNESQQIDFAIPSAANQTYAAFFRLVISGSGSVCACCFGRGAGGKRGASGSYKFTSVHHNSLCSSLSGAVARVLQLGLLGAYRMRKSPLKRHFF